MQWAHKSVNMSIWWKQFKPDAARSPTPARPATPLAACVRRISCTFTVCQRHLPNVTGTNCVDKANKKWLPWQRPVRDLKFNLLLIIYSHSSTNPVNLAKIGPVDVEIIGLQGIFKIRNSSRTCCTGNRTYQTPYRSGATLWWVSLSSCTGVNSVLPAIESIWVHAFFASFIHVQKWRQS